jgi:hypothetical protein
MFVMSFFKVILFDMQRLRESIVSWIHLWVWGMTPRWIVNLFGDATAFQSKWMYD